MVFDVDKERQCVFGKGTLTQSTLFWDDECKAAVLISDCTDTPSTPGTKMPKNMANRDVTRVLLGFDSVTQIDMLIEDLEACKKHIEYGRRDLNPCPPD